MASIKISELNELEEANSTDYLPIVDTSADETKKISFENFKSQIFEDGFNNRIVILTTTRTNVQADDGLNFSIELPTGYTESNSIIIGGKAKLTNEYIEIVQDCNSVNTGISNDKIFIGGSIQTSLDSDRVSCTIMEQDFGTFNVTLTVAVMKIS